MALIYRQGIISCLILVSAYAGDIVANQSARVPLLLRAAADSGTHFLIACLSWFFIETGNTVKYTAVQSVVLILCCGLFSSAIDVDHFITARSFYLEDAVTLQGRPFLHCTTIFLFVFATLLPLALYTNSEPLYVFCWLLLTASITHHWRDGYRRGIWLSKNLHIPPYSYGVYLFGISVAIPCLFLLCKGYSDKLILVKRPLRVVEL